MTLPYVSVTKAHMVEIIVLEGFPVAFNKMFPIVWKKYEKDKVKKKNLKTRILRFIYERDSITKYFNEINSHIRLSLLDQSRGELSEMHI